MEEYALDPELLAALRDFSPVQLADMGVLGLGGDQPFVSPYTYINAPLTNKGNPSARQGFSGNQIGILADQPVRLFDRSTNQVVFEGTGVEAAQRAVALAQDLSNTQGKKASWRLETATPGGTDWNTIATDKKNNGILGTIADIALPVAANFLLPGLGTIGASALGSAASSVAQGRSLEDTLLRAGLTAATAGAAKGLGIGAPAPGSDAAINRAVNTAVNTAYQNAISGAGAELASAYGTNLISNILGNVAAPVASSVAPSAIEDIVVTATQNAAPSIAASGAAGATSALLPEPQVDEITVTAPEQPPVAETPPISVPYTVDQLLSDIQQPNVDRQSVIDKITKNMDVLDYLRLASLAGGAVLGSGGGGAAAPTTPYVSQFGSGPTLGGSGTQMTQTAPYSGDYERYGFGPEYTFFNQQYKPLI